MICLYFWPEQLGKQRNHLQMWEISLGTWLQIKFAFE